MLRNETYDRIMKIQYLLLAWQENYIYPFLLKLDF